MDGVEGVKAQVFWKESGIIETGCTFLQIPVFYDGPGALVVMHIHAMLGRVTEWPAHGNSNAASKCTHFFESVLIREVSL